MRELLDFFVADAERTLVSLSEAVEQDDTSNLCDGLTSLGDSAAVIGAERLVELCKTTSAFGKDRITLAERALVASLRSEVARVAKEVKDHAAVGPALPGSGPDQTNHGDLC